MASFQALRAQRETRQRPLRRGVGATADAPESHSAATLAEGRPSDDRRATAVEEDTAPAPDAHLYPELNGTALEVRVSAISGRGLYATKDIAKGTTLLQIPPQTAVLSTAKLQTHCSGCFQKRKVQRCAACKALHYCSAACQTADWAGAHRAECAALRRFRGMWARAHPQRVKDGSDNSWVLHEAVRAMGRMCWMRRAQRKNGVDPDWWTQVAAMVPSAAHDEMQLASQVQHLQHYLAASEPLAAGADADLLHPADMASYGFRNARELLDMCSAFMNNSFTLTTSEMDHVGVATSPVCALFNHACWPNAVIVFPKAGTGMHAVAIDDIPKGQQVLTSYLDVARPYADRQLEVRERYGFTCACNLCAREDDPAWVDPRWSVKHPGCAQAGTGRMPDLNEETAQVTCTCGSLFTLKVTALRSAIQRGKALIAEDEASSLTRDDVDRLAAAIAQLTPLVPDSAHPLLQLLHLQAIVLIPPTSKAEKDAATALLARAIDGAHAGSYPPHHPAVAVWLSERAHLLLVDGLAPEQHTRVTLDELTEVTRPAMVAAIAASNVAFGKGGTISEVLETELVGLDHFLESTGPRR